MGKLSLSLTFDNGNKSVFKPGDVMRGKVLVSVTKAIKIKSMYWYSTAYIRIDLDQLRAL